MLELVFFEFVVCCGVRLLVPDQLVDARLNGPQLQLMLVMSVMCDGVVLLVLHQLVDAWLDRPLGEEPMHHRRHGASKIRRTVSTIKAMTIFFWS